MAETTTENKILQAARKVFQRKGMMGARMQEIADEADINKALLHYYFRSKEKLFERVLHEIVGQGFPVLSGILNDDLPLEEKIRQFVRSYIEILQNNEFLPSFVILEANRDPQKLLSMVMSHEIKPNPMKFLEEVQAAVDTGEISPIRPEQLLLNMISMCIFPFLMKPLFSKGKLLPEEKIQIIMKERKTAVAEFIINAIKPKT